MTSTRSLLLRGEGSARELDRREDVDVLPEAGREPNKETSQVGGVRGIVVFDLDGTLLRGSTVCELIAESLGRNVEMRRFETLSSEDEIAKSRVEMAAWYKDKTLDELCMALEGAYWRNGVPEAMQVLRASGIEVAVASITWRFAV
jgi:phosphoserine phosphatase